MVMSVLNRLWRHVWAGEREAKRVFPPAALARIGEFVAESEARHRGELRVVIQGGLGWAALRGVPPSRELALMHFAQQGVWDTEDNSGVLIYLLMAEHRLEIVADRGIHRRVPQAEWDAIASMAIQRFASGDYLVGMMAAEQAISDLLARHFPATPSQLNPNELPDLPVRL